MHKLHEPLLLTREDVSVSHLFTWASHPCPARVSGGLHLLFGRDVAIHQRAALHARHLDMGGDVPELQAQVLPSDGDFGAPFPGARHRDYLEGGSTII